jgi:hypothetical protein
MNNKNSIILNHYRELASKSKFGVKKRVENAIALYNSRTLYNIKTVKNVLDKLTADKRKDVDIGIKKYNEVVDKYKDAEPLPVRRKRAIKEKTEKKVKAVLKIQNLLRNSAVFDITKKDEAFKGNVISYTVKAQRIGRIVSSDIKTILYKAYSKVVKLLPKNAKFKFYSQLNFETSAEKEKCAHFFRILKRVSWKMGQTR